MWVTEREAIRLLGDAVVGRAQAEAVLRAGLAGPRHPLPGGHTTAVLYDEGAVLELAARPTLDLPSASATTALSQACPHGLYLARLRRATDLDVTQEWERAVAQVATMPAMPAMTAALLDAWVRAWGRLPWIATLCGFVVLGADLTGTVSGTGGVPAGRRFVLEPPGPWFAALRGRRLPTGRGGRPWVLWWPPLSPAPGSAPAPRGA
jgi:hypothetical protein